MDRRTFIGTLAGGLLAAPLVAEAQPAGKKSLRIGMLSVTTADTNVEARQGFRESLRDLGWIEGQNILVEERWAE